ncbi:MAG: AAA family ATPase [Flavobacteriales bacterium]|nr:AAA family ATPase [Flavobacteriales bacterium]
MPINEIEIENFKSIKKLRLEIAPINILVGPNGVGKSNLIGFFSLLKNMFAQSLQTYIATQGKANGFLHFGKAHSAFLSGTINFNNDRGYTTNSYSFRLIPDDSNSLILEEESSGYNARDGWNYKREYTRNESFHAVSSSFRNDYLRDYFNEFNTFHFHDTSRSSKLKQSNNLKDNRVLKSDGSNLAAFLYMLSIKHKTHFKLIEKTIGSIAPYFSKFDLQPDLLDENMIELVWKEVGSEQYFNAYNFSDGTLRFIALATLLLQPNPPKTIIIDEPELGLHPFAIKKLAALITNVSANSQVIVSTQSVTFLNEFTPKDIIVVDRENIEGMMISKFKRFKEEELDQWLEGYSMGEIWEKNLIGGKP